ncbi:MAG: hypothetical protein EPO27_14995 [Betaproteobacteria bacterium]|nr:MAG: hypothetical protein EPO27_14995 [Betaproteobacteria bacterium]
MFIGHAAVALAAKPLAPRVSLGLLLVAAYWIDLIWPVLLLVGLERVEIRPGDTAFTPLAFVHYPWTHSLAAVIGWSALFGFVFARLGRRAAVVLGLLVLSHWVLDALVHRPDLPLWPGSATLIGGGLWNSIAATILVEGGLFAAGVATYVRCAPARDRVGAVVFWALIGFLVLAYAANLVGPPPPSVAAIAYAGLAGGALYALWAWWADRHRGTPILQ